MTTQAEMAEHPAILLLAAAAGVIPYGTIAVNAVGRRVRFNPADVDGLAAELAPDIGRMRVYRETIPGYGRVVGLRPADPVASMTLTELSNDLYRSVPLAPYKPEGTIGYMLPGMSVYVKETDARQDIFTAVQR